MSDRTIAILGGRRESTNIVYNALKDEFQVGRVIIEAPVSRVRFLRRRIKRLGFSTALGQVLFQLIVVPYLKRRSRKRLRQIREVFGLDDSPVDPSYLSNVESVNSDHTMALLKETNPTVVVINGTRIIAERILNCIPAKFINIHAGITPLYRGVHGAYWALVEKNRRACGVTVHFVDPGIDTGNIIEQAPIEPTKDDNFATYPLLQLGTGIPLLKKAINDVFDARIEIKPSPEGKSRLWSHPTLFEYIQYRIRCGVK